MRSAAATPIFRPIFIALVYLRALAFAWPLLAAGCVLPDYRLADETSSTGTGTGTGISPRGSGGTAAGGVSGKGGSSGSGGATTYIPTATGGVTSAGGGPGAGGVSGKGGNSGSVGATTSIPTATGGVTSADGGLGVDRPGGYADGGGASSGGSGGGPGGGVGAAGTGGSTGGAGAGGSYRADGSAPDGAITVAADASVTMCPDNPCSGSASCSYPIRAGWCFVGGVCWSDGQSNPSNICQICRSSASQTQWSSNLDGTTCDDRQACTKSDKCSGGVCTGTAYSCDDGEACTNDTCDGLGGCSHTTQLGWCLISGACWSDTQANTSNSCQICAASTSQTQWTYKGENATCSGGVCQGGACTCVPNCQGKVCGGDGCGGLCGLCNSTEQCVSGACQCLNAHLTGDTFEPDECPASATALVSGVGQEHSINPAGDVDWYTFTLTQASDVSFQVWGPSGYVDVYWYGPDSSSTQFTYLSDFSISGAGHTLSKSNIPLGKYWFKVVGETSLIGSYDVLLTVTSVAPGTDIYEPDNDAASARSLPSGVTQEHSIRPAGDVDWYTFTLTQASDVSFQVWGPSGYVDVYWYGPDSSSTQFTYLSDFSISGAGHTLSKSNIPLGKYWFKVVGETSLIGSYDVLLTVTSVAPGTDIYEPDNDAASARSLPSGVTQEHSIRPAGDVDWYTFTLTQASTVSIQVWGPSGYVDVYWYGPDSSSTQLTYLSDFSISGAGHTLSRSNIPLGKYWFKVVGETSLLGSYNVLLTVTP